MCHSWFYYVLILLEITQNYWGSLLEKWDNQNDGWCLPSMEKPCLPKWWFPKIGLPPVIIHFRLVFSIFFHEINPFSELGVPPWLWKPPDGSLLESLSPLTYCSDQCLQRSLVSSPGSWPWRYVKKEKQAQLAEKNVFFHWFKFQQQLLWLSHDYPIVFSTKRLRGFLFLLSSPCCFPAPTSRVSTTASRVRSRSWGGRSDVEVSFQSWYP